jgi:hypothetical protein
VLQASVAKRTLDNITVVTIAFQNFKRLAFPESENPKSKLFNSSTGSLSKSGSVNHSAFENPEKR